MASTFVRYYCDQVWHLGIAAALVLATLAGGALSCQKSTTLPAASADTLPADPAKTDIDLSSRGFTPSDSTATREVQVQAQDALHHLAALAPEASRSLGSPLEGSLIGGVALPDAGPGFFHNPNKRPQARYGTVELVQALVGAGAALAREFPGYHVTINDLSLQSGGPISGHGSHRSGRDVDILFFLRDAKGAPFSSMAIPLELDGSGSEFGNLADPADDRQVHLDAGPTWAYLAALLSQPHIEVQRIFIAEHLRDLLLRHAKKQGSGQVADKAIIQRFADVTCQPEFPHDDHMHVRIFCPIDDVRAGCQDTLPWYPWHLKRLEKSGLTPNKAGKRQGEAPDITTVDKARANVGPLDDAVTAFLERRRAWQRQPHPGRPYCR